MPYKSFYGSLVKNFKLLSIAYLHIYYIFLQRLFLSDFQFTIIKCPKICAKIMHAVFAGYAKIQNFDIVMKIDALTKEPDELEVKERRSLEQPEFRNNILMVTHWILQANTHARKMLKQANDELDKAVDDLRNALFVRAMEEPQTSFKTREVYDLVRR